MNLERIIRHAVVVVRRYRALWVLGFIWALVGGAGSGGVGNFQYTFSGNEFEEFDSFAGTDLSGLDVAAIAGVVIPAIVGLCCLVLLLIVVTTVVRYVVMVGVMRGLDHLDRFGTEPTVRGAWAEGWNVRTWRPFVQNLIVGIPLAIVILLTLTPVVAPLLLGLFGEDVGFALGIVAACCLFCCWMVAVFVVLTVVSVLQELWWRAAVLDDLDFVSAIVAGWRLARANVGRLFTAWIVMFVVGIVWMVLSVTVALAFGLVTAAAAGIPAFILYQSSSSWVLPALVGGTIALVTFVLPMIFTQGLYLVFHASVWNQIYRQLPNRAAAGLEWSGL